MISWATKATMDGQYRIEEELKRTFLYSITKRRLQAQLVLERIITAASIADMQNEKPLSAGP